MTSSDSPIDRPPERAVEGGTIRYGRYRQPIPQPNIAPSTWLGRYRLKEWHYTSVTTERFFLAFGLVQLGYLANAFGYLVDRRAKGRCWEYEAMSPLGLGLRFAPSSVHGTTTLRLGRARIEIGWDRGWDIALALPLDGERLEAELHVEPGEGLALLHELPSGRPAYTHKAAALPASGEIRWQQEVHRVDRGLASIDWTRALALRQTRWKWASLSGRLDDGRRVGLNLSADVYDDEAGDSRENALWLDGRLVPLGGVDFDLPRSPARQPWSLHSRRGCPDEVELLFTPSGARQQRVDLKLLKSVFIQPFGSFRGRIRPAGGDPIFLDDAFGVVEDHLSVW